MTHISKFNLAAQRVHAGNPVETLTGAGVTATRFDNGVLSVDTGGTIIMIDPVHGFVESNGQCQKTGQTCFPDEDRIFADMVGPSVKNEGFHLSRNGDNIVVTCGAGETKNTVLIAHPDDPSIIGVAFSAGDSIHTATIELS